MEAVADFLLPYPLLHQPHFLQVKSAEFKCFCLSFKCFGFSLSHRGQEEQDKPEEEEGKPNEELLDSNYDYGTTVFSYPDLKQKYIIL